MISPAKSKKFITAICIASLFLASSQANGMLVKAMKALGMAGIVGITTTIKAKYCPGEPVIYDDNYGLLIPEFITSIQNNHYPTPHAYRAAFPELINFVWQLNTLSKRTEKHHRAPKKIQKFMFRCVKASGKPYSFSGWAKRWFQKITGRLTVYDGPPSWNPDYFSNNPRTLAFTNGQIGGIFFPKNSFIKGEASPRQRLSIAHESVHVDRGPIKTSKWSPIWFQEEYAAQKGATTRVFKLGDYEALDEGVGYILEENPAPYHLGARDGFFAVVKKNPKNQKIESLRKKLLRYAEAYKNTVTRRLNNKNGNSEKQRKDQNKIAKANEIIAIFSDPRKHQIPTQQERLKEFTKESASGSATKSH